MGRDPLRSTLSLSLTLRKLTVSIPRPWCGMMGGFMCRISAHCVVRKNGCVLMSDAPARAPSRRFSSLIRSLRIRDLQRLVGCQHCKDNEMAGKRGGGGGGGGACGLGGAPGGGGEMKKKKKGGGGGGGGGGGALTLIFVARPRGPGRECPPAGCWRTSRCGSCP